MQDHQPNPDDLQPWADYWRSKPDLFKNKEAASHFVQSRKARMQELGILFETVRGYLVVRPELDKHLLRLLETTDGRPRVSQYSALMEKPYINAAELCQLLPVDPQQLRELCQQGKGPNWIRMYGIECLTPAAAVAWFEGLAREGA